MGENSLAVTPGSGLLLRTWQRTVGAATVDEQFMQLATPPYATYSVTTAALSIAVANSHVVQLTAGTALPVYVESIEVWQAGTATAAGFAQFDLVRLTSAGTGGAAITPSPLDTGDAVASCAVQSLPGTATKGAEGVTVWGWFAPIQQTAATGAPPLISESWESLRSKPVVIPAGGWLALKCVTAVAAGTVRVVVKFQESAA